ncbi:hypothetical protein INR49_029601, partial [Caranx melampygus]
MGGCQVTSRPCDSKYRSDNNARDSLAGEVIFYPESTGHSLEGSGHNVDSTGSQKVTSGKVSEVPVQTNVFTSVTNQDLSGPIGPCVLGLSPCVALKSL